MIVIVALYSQQENVELKARVEALEQIGTTNSVATVAATTTSPWQIATLGLSALVILLLGFVVGLLARRPGTVTNR